MQPRLYYARWDLETLAGGVYRGKPDRGQVGESVCLFPGAIACPAQTRFVMHVATLSFTAVNHRTFIRGIALSPCQFSSRRTKRDFEHRDVWR